MAKIVVLMHISLDGFVAGPNGEMDWIRINDEIFNIAFERTNEAGTALYGRITFQIMDNYWPTAAEKPNASKHDFEHSAWYKSVHKVVISKTMADATILNTTIISENVTEKIKELKQATDRDILLLGSPSVVHILLEENLIDDYWLCINPIILGEGIPLFKNAKDRIKLNLVSSNIFAGNVICVHYTKA